TREIEKVVYPAVLETVSAITSVRNNEGQIRIGLVPATERNRSNTEIADDLRKRLDGKIPGMQVRTRAPQGQFLLSWLLGNDDGIAVEVRGFELDILRALARETSSALEKI